MKNRTVTATAVLACAALSVVPAHAATKKRPAPIKKSYAVTLTPDPSPNATNTAGMGGCTKADTLSTNVHAVTVPAAGKLHVVLDSPDPTGTGTTDWDLYVEDADGTEEDSSHGGTSHEETTTVFKKKTAVNIVVCNLAGAPNGTVTYTFTYK